MIVQRVTYLSGLNAVAIVGALLGACVAGVSDGRRDGGGETGPPVGETGGGSGGASERPSDLAADKRCVGLQCQQVSCAGQPTSVSGTVYAPNGTLPLYNVIVYVPNAPLEPFPPGISCDRCGALASGRPIASAISDSQGRFRINDVPVGANIPLVFQVGKWRRKITIASVTACQDNPLADANLTRLPRNRQEGDLPRIAVTTGYCDQLGCLLPKLGVDVAELGASGDNRAVTFFRGGGIQGVSGGDFGPANMRDAGELWTDETALSRFDVTVLSCECGEFMENKSAAAFTAMTNYLAKGGRIFGTDFAYMWLKYSPDAALKTAVAIKRSGATPTMGSSPMTIDTSFPKGKAMADWMKFVDPTVTYGQITAPLVYDNVESVTGPSGLTWASSPIMATPLGPPPGAPLSRVLTVNTPAGIPADKQCGRAVHLDAHITILDNWAAAQPFPAVCGDTLSKGEEALAFLFFDLASCIQDDRVPVEPPIIVP